MVGKAYSLKQTREKPTVESGLQAGYYQMDFSSFDTLKASKGIIQLATAKVYDAILTDAHALLLQELQRSEIEQGLKILKHAAMTLATAAEERTAAVALMQSLNAKIHRGQAETRAVIERLVAGGI